MRRARVPGQTASSTDELILAGAGTAQAGMEARARRGGREASLGERDGVVEDAAAAVVVAAGPQGEVFPFGLIEADERVGEDELEGVGARGGVRCGEHASADGFDLVADAEEEGVEIEAGVFAFLSGELRREGVVS